jgi:hypothetical protein
MVKSKQSDFRIQEVVTTLLHCLGHGTSKEKCGLGGDQGTSESDWAYPCGYFVGLGKEFVFIP